MMRRVSMRSSIPALRSYPSSVIGDQDVAEELNLRNLNCVVTGGNFPLLMLGIMDYY